MAAHKNGISQEKLHKEYPRLAEIPFDSDRKLMTSVNRVGGKTIAIVKGAFDVMASKCVQGNIETARKINDQMSANALRVLAIAYKELEQVSGQSHPRRAGKTT